MKNAFSLFGLLAIIIVVLAVFAGWAFNIVEIIHIVNDPITGMLILRIVGIFVFPLGAILGWF